MREDKVESSNEPKDKKKMPTGARIVTAVCSVLAVLFSVIGGILGGA